jgi:Rab-like protein 3
MSSAAARILIAGDAAVGKTALVEMICSGKGRSSDGDWSEFNVLPQQTEWTCGCVLNIVKESLEVDLRPMEVELELWEVGGTRMYSRARPVFYEGLDGILLVYDVSNVKSYHNLVMWLYELCTSALPPSLRYWDTGGGSGGVPDVDIEQGGLSRELREAILSGSCPVLFVAHKADLRQKGEARASLGRPQIPAKPPLLDRLLGGEGFTNFKADDALFMEELCDFVLQGRHMDASSRTQSFDFNTWRDFIRRTLEAKRRSGES